MQETVPRFYSDLISSEYLSVSGCTVSFFDYYLSCYGDIMSLSTNALYPLFLCFTICIK